MTALVVMVRAAHWLVALAMVACVVRLPFVAGVEVWFPMYVVFANWLFEGNCPLTLLENKLRRKVGLEPLENFLKWKPGLSRRGEG